MTNPKNAGLTNPNNIETANTNAPSARCECDESEGGDFPLEAAGSDSGMDRELMALYRAGDAFFRCRDREEIAKLLCEVMLADFRAHFARVWMIAPGDVCRDCVLASHCPNKIQCLHLVASMGHYTHLDGPHRRVPLGAFKIGLIAQGAGKTVTNDIANDPRIHNHAWAKSLGLQSFAGYPLIRDGEVLGVMAMFSRFTLLDSQFQALDMLATLGSAAIKSVDYANALKEEREARTIVLANIAHEIRTPLNAILGMTNLLMETALDGRQREYAATLRSGGQALSAYINDLLDLTKAEAGHMVLERTRFRLRECAESACDLFAHAAREKGLDLQIRWDESLPETVIGDFHRLRQILMNLIGNAVKFTAYGGVTVAVRRLAGAEADADVFGEAGTRREDSAVQVKFSVIDTGIGIEPEKIAKIFQAFSQATPGISGIFGGTGLGLAISNTLVQLMGGTISAQSRLGEGATFRFTVVLTPDTDKSPSEPASADASDAAAEPPILSAGARILIADDMIFNREVLQAMVRRLWNHHDVTVDLAADGAEALALASSRQYDLIFLDARMPKMDGFAAARAIRTAWGSRVALVMTSGLPASEMAALSVGAEIDAFLSKPFTLESLNQIVRTLRVRTNE